MRHALKGWARLIWALLWVVVVIVLWIKATPPLEGQRPPDAFEAHPADYVAPEYFRGVLYRLQDGDTYDTELDLGFTTHKFVRIRLRGVDTPESFSQNRRIRTHGWTREEVAEERARGLAATAWVAELCKSQFVRVRTSFAQSLNRWVGDVDCWVDSSRWVSVADTIVAAGHVARVP